MFKSNRLITPFVPILWIITNLPLVCLGILLIILIQFAVVKLLRGTGGFKESVQTFAYSTPMIIFLSVPYLNILAITYQLFLLFLALKRFHNLENSKSALVVVILLGFGMIVGLLFELF